MAGNADGEISVRVHNIQVGLCKRLGRTIDASRTIACKRICNCDLIEVANKAWSWHEGWMNVRVRMLAV